MFPPLVGMLAWNIDIFVAVMQSRMLYALVAPGMGSIDEEVFISQARATAWGEAAARWRLSC